MSHVPDMNCEGFIDSSFPVFRRNVHCGGSGTIKVIVRPKSVADDMRWHHSVLLKPGQLWIYR
jgi:hypothetical protein